MQRAGTIADTIILVVYLVERIGGNLIEFFPHFIEIVIVQLILFKVKKAVICAVFFSVVYIFFLAFCE